MVNFLNLFSLKKYLTGKIQHPIDDFDLLTKSMMINRVSLIIFSLITLWFITRVFYLLNTTVILIWLSISAICLLCLILNKLKFIELASFMIIFLFTLFLSISLIFYGVNGSLFYIAFVIPIILTQILLGNKYLIVITSYILVYGFLIYYLQVTNILVINLHPIDPLEEFFSQISIILLSITVIELYSIVQSRAKISLENNFLRLQIKNQSAPITDNKLEDIGLSLLSVTHDFNNLLSIISDYNSILIKEMEENSALKSTAMKIAEITGRGTKLTNQLMNFNKPVGETSEDININDLIKSEQLILNRMIGNKIKLILDLDNSISNSNINSTKFDQILFNLITNSKQAIDKHGTITIRTKKTIHKELGECILLVVQDTGKGMIDEVKEHIFGPFFTTKKEGHGIGLFTVKKIIVENKGIIDIVSKINAGTSIKIFFKEIR